MNVIDAALGYAARGWHVHRLAPRQKVPPAGSHGQHDSTRDPDVIRSWPKDCNIGLDLERSDLIALDVDGEDWRARLDAAIEKYGPLVEGSTGRPSTLAQRTGTRSLHIIVRGIGAPVRGTLTVEGHGSITLRGKNYVVLAPSTHPNGRAYEWWPGHGPDDVDVGELSPRWRAAIVRPADPPPPISRTRTDVREIDPDRVLRRARSYLSKLPPAISGSNGHTTTLRAAIAMVRGFGLDEHHAFDLLVSDYNGRCSPPWRERDLRRKIREASRAQRVPFLYLLGDR